MPSDPATLRALAARAEAGGDDALSDDCWRALGHTPWTGDLWHHPDCLGPIRRGDLRRSLDAQEGVGPAVLFVRHFDGGKWRAETERGVYFEDEATAPTEALARLAAKLKALAAQMEAAGG